MSTQSGNSKSLEALSIYIIGAQSTGKTTLVKALASYFESSPMCLSGSIPQPAIVTEVARKVLQTHQFTANDIEHSPARALQLQRLILGAQNEAEAALESGWFISDRSGIDAAVYAERYGGSGGVQALMDDEAWHAILQRMRSALVIVCEAGVTWLVDDGVRLMPKSLPDWMQLHHLFCRRLEALGLDFAVLPRDLEDRDARLRFVVERWESKHRRQLAKD